MALLRAQNALLGTICHFWARFLTKYTNSDNALQKDVYLRIAISVYAKNW